MKTKRVGRPLNATPSPRAPKAETQADKDWGSEARRVLKVEMEARSWGYRDLSEHLAKMGVDIDPPTINRRINRANFSAGFLLMCLKVMNLRFDVVPEANVQTRRTINEKPLDALENVVSNWKTKSR
jgi:hypothetical protein